MMHAVRMHGTPTEAARKPAVYGQPDLEATVKGAIAVLEDYKAQNVVVMPLAGKASFADFLVIGTGTSTKHVTSMGQALQEKMRSEIIGMEGMREGDWVCADLGNVVVHMFTADKRALYNLEKLWSYTFLPVE